MLEDFAVVVIDNDAADDDDAISDVVGALSIDGIVALTENDGIVVVVVSYKVVCFDDFFVAVEDDIVVDGVVVDGVDVNGVVVVCVVVDCAVIVVVVDGVDVDCVGCCC